MHPQPGDSLPAPAGRRVRPLQLLETAMNDINPQPLPPFADRVRVHVPQAALYDLAKMNRITANVLGRLGCGGCHSGRILDFVALDEFVVNPVTLEAHEALAGRQLG
jgi:hypothetical protein